MAKVKRRRGHRKVSAWSRGQKRNADGLTFRDIARASLAKINARRGKLKKCSATAKSTGERCGQLAMKNGKCRYHGGKTPAGDQWHVVQFDLAGAKNGSDRLVRKLQTAEKARRARRLKLARATEAERQRYQQWLTDRPPGSKAHRLALRIERRLAAETRKRVAAYASVEAPKSEEILEIEAKIAELKFRRAALEPYLTGVFS